MSVNVPTFPQSSWSSFPFSSIQHVTIVHGHNSIDGRSPLAAEGWAGGDRFGSETQGVALHWCGQGTPELNIKGIIFTIYIYIYTYTYIYIYVYTSPYPH